MSREPGRQRPGARRASAVLCLSAVVALSGCSSIAELPLVSDVSLPKIPVPQVLHIEDTTDHPSNLIERALSGCDKRTEPGETACLKKAVADAHLTVPALADLIGSCRLGQLCHHDYTTQDVVGFDRTIASRYVVHWRASFDLTHAPATVDAVPITVVQAS